VTKFLVRRLLIAIPTLLGISLVLFAVVALAPGDPFAELAMNPNVPPELRLQLRQQLGIDDPLHIQYFRWASSMARGNWGISFVNRIPVADLIWGRLPATLFIAGSSYLVALLIALPAGIVSAVKQYSWLDNIATTFAFLGYSLPTFFTGLLFILIFTVKLGWLPEMAAGGLHDQHPGQRMALGGLHDTAGRDAGGRACSIPGRRAGALRARLRA
jgi:peptide/nickel transport system permease protein